MAVVASACILSIGLRLPAQSIVVGTVLEDSTGRPLADVGITIEGAKQQAQSDSAGRYAIEAPPRRTGGASWTFAFPDINRFALEFPVVVTRCAPMRRSFGRWRRSSRRFR